VPTEKPPGIAPGVAPLVGVGGNAMATVAMLE
jgi:hypothetical protein